MSNKKTIRIPATPGDKIVRFEVNQNFDLLEILSLKFTQQEVYSSFCSDYGVVCGRVTSNNGYGISNAKVSIFVPIKDVDVNDPVISKLYPYTNVMDKNSDGYRYNLLPLRKQHGGHAPTGTFPDQTDILNREEVLEVYENYYNFTVKTNSAGDFMIWGVPLGTQTIHVDVDLSDMNCFSLRPYDFVRQGVDEEQFDRYYRFKSDSDIDGLPQIVSFDKTIEVYPFWGNKDLCEIGISRVDFDLSSKGIKVQPIALMLMSSVTDNDHDAIKRSGVIRPKSGYKCKLETKKGKIEGVRYTGNKVLGSDGVTVYPELETFNPGMIDDDGTSLAVLPMNLEYVFTNEFGEEEITNDPNKGIPTTMISRFRISLDHPTTVPNKGTMSAHYLIPNIREFNSLNGSGRNDSQEYNEEMLSTYTFSDVFEDYINVPLPTGMTFSYDMDPTYKEHKKELILGTNNDDIPEDYFYKFIYGKVYTPSSFQGTHYQDEWQGTIPAILGATRRDSFLGIKEIRPSVEDDCSSSTNYIPTNFGFRNRIKFSLLITQILLFLQLIFSIIIVKVFEILGRIFLNIGQALYGIYFGWPFNWRPFCAIGENLQYIAYLLQDKGTQTLPLTIYPDCEECSQDSDTLATDASLQNQYYSIGEVKCKVFGVGEHFNQVLLIPIDISTGTTTGTTFLPKIFTKKESSARGLGYTGTTGFIGTTGYTAQALNITTLTTLDSLFLNPYQMTEGDDNDSRFVTRIFPLVDDTILPYSGTSFPQPVSGRTKSQTFTDLIMYFNEHGENFEVSNLISFDYNIVRYNDGTNYWFGTGQTGNYYNVSTNIDLMANWIDIYGNHYYNNSGTYYTLYNSATFNTETYSNFFGINYDTYTQRNTSRYPNGINTPNGDGTIRDLGLYAVLKIYDRAAPIVDPSSAGATIAIEEGCQKYDKLYNEDTSLEYIWADSNVEYGNPYLPHNPENGFSTGFYLGKTKPTGVGYDDYTIMADIGAADNSGRLPRLVRWSCIGNSYFDRKTKSGLSEVRDGVFTCIPVIQGSSNNLQFLLEWYKRKRVNAFFCGGALNYSFIDSWLHGVLYFFKFDFRIRWDDFNVLDLNQRGSSFPRSLVFFNVLDQNFYYRSTPYDPSISPKNFIGQYADRTGSYVELLHPTTFYDVGVRDEFLYEICYDPRVDPSASVIRDITNSSYQDPGYIIEHVINYRMDVSNAKFDISDFFTNGSAGLYGFGKILDGDIMQLISINCEAGIEAFDLDSPQYFMFNGEYLDPEDPTFSGYFDKINGWGPTPIDFKLDLSGRFVRTCLNYYLGDYTQKVPFYLWDKKGEGFGTGGNLSDDQLWDKTQIATMKLQRMFSIDDVNSTTTNYIMADGEEEYLLKPMTIDHPTFIFTGNTMDSMERFEERESYSPVGVVDPLGYVEGDLWLQVTSGTTKNPLKGNIYVIEGQTWTGPITYVKDDVETFIFPTLLNYSGEKQVLSTPFHFYFGLRPGSTPYDKFIKYYGPKGAFTAAE